MASDALFLALANASAQPDRWARALGAGTGAANDIVGGYMQGRKAKLQREEQPLELASKKAALANVEANIGEKLGPDQAHAMMGDIYKSAGMDVPTFGNSTGNANQTDYTPEQLSKMGQFGSTRLGSQEKAQTLSNNAPFSPEVANFVGSGDIEGLTKYHSTRGETVPYREVQQAIAAKRPQFMGAGVQLRGRQDVLAALPSHQSASSPAGAASGVQLAVRQGKGLIANPLTDPKRIGLASLDAARSVLRAAPQLDAVRGSNYAETLSNNLNDISNKFSSGQMKPEDIPAVRKQLFDTFTELENTSRPLIERELSHAEKSFGGYLPPDWEDMKKDELGLNFPEIKFNPGAKAYQKTAKNAQGVTIGTNDNWATYEPVQGGQ